MADKWMAVGEVARRSGVAVSALHYYESRGLLHSVRSAGNQRRYRRDVLRRLAFIRAAQQVGIGLEEIAEALAELHNLAFGAAAAGVGADGEAAAVLTEVSVIADAHSEAHGTEGEHHHVGGAPQVVFPCGGVHANCGLRVGAGAALHYVAVGIEEAHSGGHGCLA